MPKQTFRRRLVVVATALLVATAAAAQVSASNEPVTNGPGEKHSWRHAQASESTHPVIQVITFDHPDRRHRCRVHSIEDDKLVCARTIGAPRTYRITDIAALIIPGDPSPLTMWLAFNTGMGASIWGTVVLTATCPACAAATAFAALVFFELAGLTVFADTQPDRLLYLAPGHQLSRKLGYVSQ